MENAASALKMGAAILVFVIALSTVFMIFAQAKQVSEVIFYSTDQNSFMEYVEADANQTKRIVGIETIIPTLYKYYRELYTVKIIDSAGNLLGEFDVDKENLGATALVQRIDEFVNNTLLTSAYRDQKYIESFKEYDYRGSTYTDEETGETIKDKNTRTKTDITYQIIK